MSKLNHFMCLVFSVTSFFLFVTAEYNLGIFLKGILILLDFLKSPHIMFHDAPQL